MVPIYDYTKLRNLPLYTTWEGKDRKRHLELGNIITFDIETSNGYLLPEKGTVIGFNHYWYRLKPERFKEATPVSLMYVWQVAVETTVTNEPVVFMGRTWEDFRKFLDELSDNMKLLSAKLPVNSTGFIRQSGIRKAYNHPLVHIYIHNLGFEFQHIRNVFDPDQLCGKVFARSPRKPMRVKIQDNGITLCFNDTLVLTQKSLKNWCKDANLTVKKLEEPRDYYLPVRTPETPLKQEEIDYSINDVVCMVYGIQKYRDKYGSLANIPMTQTGEVRRKCMAEVAEKVKSWSDRCRQVTASYTFDLFIDIYKCFAGGWTHANAFYTKKLVKNVKCFDFRSSYPAVMCSRKFPVGEWTECTDAERTALMSQDPNDRDYLFYIEFECENLDSKTMNTFWSESKCDIDGESVIDNGKVVSADHFKATMTDLDFDVFCRVYDYDSMTITKCMKSKAEYLPKELVNLILSYYKAKTSLKGTGRDSEYAEAKQFINSIYGVFVTKIITDEVGFYGNEGWCKDAVTVHDFDKQIEKMTEGPMFTMYQVGVWVTAWARHNLWDAIEHLDTKTVYCDTDSIKGIFDDDDLAWFNQYNDSVWAQCMRCAKALGIDPEMYRPKTPKGTVKELGFFDREDDCLEFKTLGAKRYADTIMVGKRKVLQTTIAGLPKSAGKAKIKSVADFDEHIVWEPNESEKLTATYNDDQPCCEWIDRNGKHYYSIDRFGVCLTPVEFTLDMSEEYRLLVEVLNSGELGTDIYFDTAKIFRNA